MIKVAQYIETLGTDKYKELVSASFDYNILGFIDIENTHILFQGWLCQKFPKYVMFTNENVILEFHDNHFDIRKAGSNVRLPIPETINDFINIMYLSEIDLYWANWIEEKFEPKDLLPQNNIKDYFMELLKKMGKDFELNVN